MKEDVSIEEGNRRWHIGDVFTTNFWGVTEVCIIYKMQWGEIYFIRLESIRSGVTLKKDFCMAGLDIKLFNRINKTFLHHSEWYSDYTIPSPLKPIKP